MLLELTSMLESIKHIHTQCLKINKIKLKNIKLDSLECFWADFDATGADFDASGADFDTRIYKTHTHTQCLKINKIKVKNIKLNSLECCWNSLECWNVGMLELECWNTGTRMDNAEFF